MTKYEEEYSCHDPANFVRAASIILNRENPSEEEVDDFYATDVLVGKNYHIFRKRLPEEAEECFIEAHFMCLLEPGREHFEALEALMTKFDQEHPGWRD